MPEAAGGAAPPPTRLAIGLPGGFAVDEVDASFETVREHALVLLPSRARVTYPHAELPLCVTLAVDALLAHSDASQAEAVTAWEEQRAVSKWAAELVQEPAEGRRVPPDPKLWRDAETGATDNLWLNLSDGYIGGGRRNWDGSGGSGSALRHYTAMRAEGKHYPLAVKLGTISARGGDVYSYEEDDMVEDPLLADHLAHWGIDVMALTKTERSMAELEIDLNRGFEFDRVTEAGAALVPLSGPGYVGLANLGNSCYMNSALQLLKELPWFGAHHAAAAAHGAVFASAPPEPADDLRVQLAKLAAGLLLPPARAAVRPSRFRSLIGRGHPEFSSPRQQDVVEFLAHLLTRLDAAGLQPPGAPPPSSFFQFGTHIRDVCAASGAARYRQGRESVLMLHIPEEAAVNAPDVRLYKERQAKRQRLRSEGAAAYISADGDSAAAAAEGGDGVTQAADEPPVRPVVPFAACLARFVQPESIDKLSLGGGTYGPGLRTTHMSTFPPYLALQMGRFTLSENWVPLKMDVLCTPPTALSLESLRAGQPAPGEALLPPDQAPPPPPLAAASGAGPLDDVEAASTLAAMPLAADETIVAQLVSMGFSENGSRRAALATGNAGAEAGMEWVFAHMEDADFNEPLPPPGARAAASPPVLAAAGAAAEDNPAHVATLAGMGFSARAASAALRSCGGSLEGAANWLFNSADAESAAEAFFVAAAAAPPAAPPAALPDSARAPTASTAVAGEGGGLGVPLDDGPGEYTLVVRYIASAVRVMLYSR